MRAPLRHRCCGISLVDLMVGLVVGMVATLVILNVTVMFGARQRSIGTINDSQLNAVHAMAAVTRELRMSGHGLGPPDAIGCTVHRAVAGPSATLAWRPLQIEQGAGGAPDALTVLSGSERATPAARLISPYTIGNPTLMLDTTLELMAGDWLVLQSSARPDCALLRVATVSPGSYSVAPVPSSSALSGTVFAADSAAINVGTLRLRRFSVDADFRLQLEVFDAVRGEWQVSTLADGIASLQLQYGFDARPGAQPRPQVTVWRDVAIDADGNGTVGDPSDWRRLLAVRIALVSFSTRPANERCDATPPQWLAGDAAAAANGAALQPVSVALDHLPDWRCKRYRLLQSEVSLRNQLWGAP